MSILNVIGLLSVALFLVLSALVRLCEGKSDPFASIRRFLRRPLGEVLLVLACACGLIQHGATKNLLGSPRTPSSGANSLGNLAWHKQELFNGRGVFDGLGGTTWAGWNIDENILGVNKISVEGAIAMDRRDPDNGHPCAHAFGWVDGAGYNFPRPILTRMWPMNGWEYYSPMIGQCVRVTRFAGFIQT